MVVRSSDRILRRERKSILEVEGQKIAAKQAQWKKMQTKHRKTLIEYKENSFEDTTKGVTINTPKAKVGEAVKRMREPPPPLKEHRLRRPGSNIWNQRIHPQ